MRKDLSDYSASERETLETVIKETVTKWRDSVARSDLKGVASGSVFNVLKALHPDLARKVGGREGLVSIAELLGYSIDSAPGGRGLRGSGPWEFIDLPE